VTPGGPEKERDGKAVASILAQSQIQNMASDGRKCRIY